MNLLWGIWLYFLVLTIHTTTGGIAGVKQLQSLFKVARRMLSPGSGHGRPQNSRNGYSRAPITFTRRTTPTAAPPLTTPLPSPFTGAESAFYNPDPRATKGSKAIPELLGPTNDILGQLAITFGNAAEDDASDAGVSSSTGTGDDIHADDMHMSARLINALPVVLSVAKPVIENFKGKENYDDLLGLLQDAKEIVSNREVIRRVNEFLDELISGNDQQTPPTPSDSSLNSLAQIAQQNMESVFNAPPQRQRSVPKRRSKEFTSDNVNYIPGTNANVNAYQKSL